MNRRQAERITSPGMALAAAISVTLIIVDPARYMLWLSPAAVAAAIGCLLGTQLSLKMRAPGPAMVFLAEALFWLGTAGFLVYLYFTRPV